MRRFLWVFLALFLSWAGLAVFIFNEYRFRDAFNQTRKDLMAIASNAALSIDTATLLAVPLEETGDSSPAYREIFGKLSLIKQTNSSLKYVYIMMATQEPGILQYVVDADPAPQIITANCPRALPGDKYDARKLPELLSAYNGPAADKKITADSWGVFISGYAPVRDSGGRPVAILGVDMDAAGIAKLQKNVRISLLSALGASCMFLISLFGILIIRPKRGI